MAAGRIVVSEYAPARDRNDALVAGAKLYVYTNGTTTLASIYTSATLVTALANPVVANSSGQFAQIWADSTLTYTVSVTGPNGESIGNPSVFDDYSPSTNFAVLEVEEYKSPVRVASTANITIASALTNGSTIDGVVVATGDRVLLKDQSTGSQNGIYVVVASGAASRAGDADTSAKVKSGITMFVSEGTANGGAVFTLTTANTITLDTTALTFSRFSGALGAGVAAFLATPSSANLAAAVTDETGSGALVFATSPTLVTPALGTPSAAVLTNATGLPVAGITASTTTPLGVGSVELGHATDTTLARSSAGNVSVEGNLIYRASGTDVPVADGGTGSSTAADARTALAVVGLVDLAASTGAALVGGIQSGTGAVAQTVQTLQRERVHVSSYGAVGDGTTDDTTALQACYTAHPGAVIDHGNGKTYIVSAQLNLASGTVYQGASALKSKGGMALVGAIMLGTAVSNVRIRGLEVNGNATAPNGSSFGIIFTGGTGNAVESAYVHDTLDGGILLESESGSRAVNNRVVNCGRTGYASNHGIIAWSITATPCQNIVIAGNTVTTAFRKGITTYSTGVGVVREVAITGNTVNGCSLGGIYVGSSGHTYPQVGIAITGNACFDNYANITLASTTGAVVSGNSCRDDTAGGIEVIDTREFAVTGNFVSDSAVHGIQASNGSGTCTNGTVTGNTVLRPNTSTAAFGAGIYLDDATNVTVSSNTVIDTASKMTQGIIEAGTSDNNVIGINKVSGATSANYSTVGASTTLVSQTGRMMGVGIAIPLNTLHIGGGLTISESTWTLANGANNNVALPANAGVLNVAGPTAVFNVSGIAGGHAGRHLRVFNYTNFAMTLNHNSASSSAGNKILIGGAADRVLAAFGTVDLVYSGLATAWTIYGSQG